MLSCLGVKRVLGLEEIALSARSCETLASLELPVDGSFGLGRRSSPSGPPNFWVDGALVGVLVGIDLE